MSQNISATNSPKPTSDYEPADPYPIPNTAFLSIEHPAILTSIQGGIKTLGGEKAIAKAAEEHEKAKLELRYRPSDPYQHPIVSQPLKAQNIVLKVGKNRESGKIERVEVVGVTDTILRFRDIADYQYQPYPDSKFNAKFHEAFDEMDYDKISKFRISLEEDDFSNADMMPPPIFSTTNLPALYNYKQNSGLRIVNGKLYHPINVDYKDKFIEIVDKNAPTVPQHLKSGLTPINQTTSGMQRCIARLKEIFSERPICARRTITNKYIERWGRGNPSVEVDNWEPIFRFCFPYVCYLFRSGPFRDMYVVYGLDPRKDKKWAGYQSVFFNFRKTRGEDRIKEENEKMTQSHLFTGKEVNTKVVCYCLCDIVDPMLRKIIDGSPLREEFHESDGWYPTDTMEKLRLVMREKLSILREGRVPTEEEIQPLMDTTIFPSAAETSLPPEEGEPGEDEEEEDEGEDEEEEEEDIANDNELNDKLETLMANIVRQPPEFQIKSLPVRTPRARPKKKKKSEDIYRDQEAE